jgi:hypothetical protein
VIIARAVVGFAEQNINLKSYQVTYEVRGRDKDAILRSVLEATDHAKQRLTDVEADAIGELQRISFPIEATKRQHERLRAELTARPVIDKLFTFRDPEDD